MLDQLIEGGSETWPTALESSFEFHKTWLGSSPSAIDFLKYARNGYSHSAPQCLIEIHYQRKFWKIDIFFAICKLEDDCVCQRSDLKGRFLT